MYKNFHFKEGMYVKKITVYYVVVVISCMYIVES